jgi:phosphoglycerol transferase MdoB-like AlkP superfamily enzyme
MESFPLVSIGILAVALLLAVAFFIFKRKEKTEPDYYTFFIMGLVWFAIGIPLGNPALSIMGAAFLLIGFLNRGKWKKQKKWSELSENEKRLKLVLLGLLCFLALAGVAVYFLAGSVV